MIKTSKYFISIIFIINAMIGIFASASEPFKMQFSENAVGFWNFDKKDNWIAKDKTIKASMPQSSGVILVPGIHGSALEFDGKDDYVEIPSLPSLDVAGSLTFAAWICMDSPIKEQDSSYPTIMEKAKRVKSSERPGVLYFNRERGSLECGFKNENGWQAVSLGKVNFIPGEWRHVAFTFDKATKKLCLYLDGELVGQTHAKGEMPKHKSPLYIGCSNENNGFFHGRIDEVIVFDKALYDYEIKKLAKKENTKYMPPSLSAPFRDNPPVVDGKISPEEWGNAAKFENFMSNKSILLSPRISNAYMCYDNENLYIAFQSAFKTTFEGAPELVDIITTKDGNLWEDDAIEVFLKPKGATNYYHFIGNSKGVFYDAKGVDASWNGNWNYKVSVDKDKGFWNAEISVPFSDLDCNGVANGAEWAVNICRDWKNPTHWDSWSYTPSFHNLDGFGKVTFRKASPVLKINSIGNLSGGEINLNATVCNFEKSSRKLEFIFKAYACGKKISENKQSISVPSKESVNVSYKTNIKDKYADMISCSLLDQAEKVSYYETRVPFCLIPPLRVKTTALPSKNILRIEADITGAHSFNKGQIEGKARLTRFDGTDKSYPLEPFKGNKSSTYIDISNIPFGKYKVSVDLKNAHGKELKAQSYFIYPARQAWSNFQAGISDDVPSPWTDLELLANNNAIKCWGREYRFENSFFPTEIFTRDKQILAAPVRLKIKTGTREYKLEESSFKILKSSPGKTIFTKDSKARDISITETCSVEYDGMIRFDLKINPSNNVQIDDIELEIPFKEENAKYFHTVIPVRREYEAGYIPEKGYKSQFHPFVWIGDEDRGLCWFAESDKDWNLKDKKYAIEILKKDGKVFLKLNIANKAYELGKPLNFTFGLHATPVKPRPSEWRKFRVINPWHKQLHSFMKSRASMYKIFTVIWPTWGKMKYHGFPLPQNEEKFNNLLNSMRDKKINPVPYMTPTCLSSANPDFEYYKAEWSNPDFYDSSSQDVLQFGARLENVCPQSSSWRNFISFATAIFIDKYKPSGLYHDWTEVTPCRNKEHGCGYEKAGAEHATFPIFAHRELRKRIYTIAKENDKNFLLIGHCSGDLMIPILSFYDIYVDGEQFTDNIQTSKDYTQIISLDRFRAEFTGRQFGLIPIFLPEFGRRSSAEYAKQKAPTETLFALLLLHDIPIWPDFCNEEVVRDVWRALDNFGMDDVEFLPYWNNVNIIENKPCHLEVSIYKKNQESMFIIANLGENEIKTNLKIDTQGLGLSDKEIVALDAFTLEKIEFADSKIDISVTPKNFRIIILKSIKQ